MPEERVAPLPMSEYSSQDETEFSEGVDFLEGRSSPELKLIRSKALIQFRCIVEDAIVRNYLFLPCRFLRGEGKNEEEDEEDLRNVTLWGVPLLPSKGDPCTDIVLTKFLEARRYSVSEAFRVLRRTMSWRRDYRVDQILDEKFSPELQSMWCTNGVDRQGRPICYHNLRAFKEKEFRNKFWRSDKKLPYEFLRWRVHCVEKEIKMLDFNPGGTSSVIHIVDVKDAPRPAINEIRWYFKRIVAMIFENYPGVIHKTFIVNVPLWFFAAYAMNLKKIMHRSREKVVFLRSQNVTKYLIKTIAPETLIPKYGGLKMENDDVEFSSDDKVLEFKVRANTIEQIKIPANQVDMTITWDVTVVGSDVTYKEEFVPSDDCSYKVLLRKEEKWKKNSTRNSFYIREAGDIVITIRNWSFKHRKVFYRSKSKPYLPSYNSDDTNNTD